MTFDQTEWDTLADDTRAELGQVSVVLARPATLGTLVPSTGLRTGATAKTTASIQATRGPTTVRDAGPGGGKDAAKIEEGRWIVGTADVVDTTDSQVFELQNKGTLTETDGAGDSRTYTITRVAPEMNGRDRAIWAQRSVAG